MGNILNVELGVCDVFFTPPGASEINLGHSIGGCEGIYGPEYHRTKVDKYTGEAERWLVGEKFGAKVPLAEASQLSILKHAITHATQTGGSGSALHIGKNAGKRTSTFAGQLRLHPIEKASGDRSADWIIRKAHATNEITMPFKNDGERVVETEFEGLVDEAMQDGRMLGVIGDSLA